MATAARRIHARVFGLVQGVFFRAETRREARRLGLAGSVRNLPDRSVEIFAEGPHESVERLLAWCRRGPPHARVDRVEVRELAPSGAESGFDIIL
ncbi:MAG TPA: acylphosphatase [Planctomycetota bacterium]|jgi:acylphosphatase|nr:acylphosphatase [Planctomycetota bacterium]HNR99705.1 acylphosphatase [Planctomycetota bacterium]HNU25324.1 acylphosphatase [Planctomycetota bacterium]HOE29407.1 acylphosphatase [Planctomycetota bacterium]HOE87485.1 acylphosphatase [Planctomycetota bacterium]